MPAKRAAILSVSWVLAGVFVGVIIAATWGSRAGTEYLAGFTIENILSVDNLAVISAVFTMQGISPRLQNHPPTHVRLRKPGRTFLYAIDIAHRRLDDTDT